MVLLSHHGARKPESYAYMVETEMQFQLILILLDRSDSRLSKFSSIVFSSRKLVRELGLHGSQKRELVRALEKGSI
jgi:hypothetical protein